MVLYFLPEFLKAIPFLNLLSIPLKRGLEQLAILTGKYCLQISQPVRTYPMNGSGDTLCDYLIVLDLACISLVAWIIWSAIDWKRPHYVRLQDCMRIGLRYSVGFLMLGYGLAKVFKSQFPFPEGESLTHEYGQSTPMHLLWFFMGYSTLYTVFAGAVEVLCGLLLFFRRTTTLGAALCLGASLNILLLNLSYDVPVKILSSHLVLASVVLLAPEFARLFSFLVLNRATGPTALRSTLFDNRYLQIGAWCIKAVALPMLVLPYFMASYATWLQYGDYADKPALHGTFQVVAMERNGEVLELVPSMKSWKRVFFSRAFPNWQDPQAGPRQMASFQKWDGLSDVFQFDSAGNVEKMTLQAWRPQEAGMPYKLTDVGQLGVEYETLSPEEAVLQFPQIAMTWMAPEFAAGKVKAPEKVKFVRLAGRINSHDIKLTLRKVESSEFLLVRTGFNWINEFPNNR